MIWDDDGFAQIFARVWRQMRIAYAWPCSLTPSPAHTSHALGRRYAKPVIRSWLGGWESDPPHSPSLTEWTHTMSFRTALTRTACAALVIGGTCAVGAAVTPALTPVPPAPAGVTEPAVDTATEAYAWDIYEHGGGSAKIRVDPTRGYRVTFMSATPGYPSWAGPNDAVLPGKDGRWFWFKVEQP